MVKVKIWGSLASATEDRTEVEIEAETLRGLLDGLAERYPAIKPQLERGISVAIDGVGTADAVGWVFLPKN